MLFIACQTKKDKPAATNEPGTSATVDAPEVPATPPPAAAAPPKKSYTAFKGLLSNR
jgi:hypothetical protein